LSHNLPSPEGKSFADWGAAVSDAIRTEVVPVPEVEAYWREWACELFYLPPFREAPTPEAFPDWQSWAFAVVKSI
jgi:hypothetical protein